MLPCMYPTRSARIILARSIFPNGQRIGVQLLAYAFGRRTINKRLTSGFAKTRIEAVDDVRVQKNSRSKLVENRRLEEAAASTVDTDRLPELYRRPVNRGSSTLRYSRLSARRIKANGQSPTLALAEWLDLNLGRESAAQTHSMESEFGAARRKSLPMVLINYLNKIKKSRISPSKNLAFPLDDEDLLTVEAKGYEAEDVAAWAYVLFTVDSEVAAIRFMSRDRAMPPFVLLELLRREDLAQQTLKKFLTYCWDILLNRPQPDRLAMVESKTKQAMTPGTHALRPNVNRGSQLLEDTTFMVMVSRLLRHARRTWPTAVVSIAKMVSVYLYILRDNARSHRNDETRLQHRLTKIYNTMITRLALPSQTFPMKSMLFNWQAQRSLLKIAGDFQPALEIDQESYRAVMAVLAASKKSESEINFVKNMARSWPPWRIEQDGIDAVRTIESDLSRTVGAIRQMKGAGYIDGSVDKAISILGGREPDGTPTIQQRQIVPARLRIYSKRKPNIYIWISRIRATRDVKEAWSAFLGFEEENPKGSLGVYHAMFEKLIFDKIRQLHRESYRALPGDGKEVMEVADENLSVDEKIRLTPPDVDTLYQRMIQHNIRPSGSCLCFLVSHAQNIESGVQYIRDSDLSPNWKEALLTNDPIVRKEYLKEITDEVFLAFIQLLCRSAYCVETPPPHESGEIEKSGSHEGSVLFNPFRPRRDHPLLQAVTLISERNPKSRPPWYALFKALAKRGVIVDLSPIGMAENDILSWKTLKAALRDSQAAGMELDSKGYRLLCLGFRKAFLGTRHLSEDQTTELNDGPAFLKELFARVKEDVPTENGIPALVHVVEAVTIHMHICVMGEIGDTEEIIEVLQWMVKNHRELEAIDAMSSNGPKIRRRCFTASRSYLEGDEEATDRARELIESVEFWGGWPTDEEVYIYRTTERF